MSSYGRLAGLVRTGCSDGEGGKNKNKREFSMSSGDVGGQLEIVGHNREIGSLAVLGTSTTLEVYGCLCAHRYCSHLASPRYFSNE